MMPQPAANRLVRTSLLAIALGVLMSGVAQLLLWLIEFISGVAFFGSLHGGNPENNHLGIGVVFVPVIGGLIVGVMARYGSPAIRGHGIPEAMEQVLTNASRIPARITWLKPLSAAISIGTGGPFGAEGPIIATGGASGSLLGQILPVSPGERKTLLAAGAAAGMAATFGSPFSALLLAVELLLFEFKARSLIPVALAVCTASAIRISWVGFEPVFTMPTLQPPSLSAFAAGLGLAVIMGGAAFVISRTIYVVEDLFEKLPIHWLWWPAIGGVAVGIIGYFEPRTLGVGYSNITMNLAGAGTGVAILMLCVLKFTSWSIALGSGTSGGTLAPLMTIGSALGWVLGVGVHGLVPGFDPHLGALLGMACLFGGASQAMLASAVFAYETTGQGAALMPLLAGCAVSVWVVRTLSKTSIMTEKIERRGVSVPSQFTADVFEHTAVATVMDTKPVTLRGDMPLAELARKIATDDASLGGHQAHPVVTAQGELAGIITRGDVVRAIEAAPPDAVVADQANGHLIVTYPDEMLHEAIHKLLHHDIGRLPVVSRDNSKYLLGYLSRSAILSARWKILKEETQEAGLGPWGRKEASH